MPLVPLLLKMIPVGQLGLQFSLGSCDELEEFADQCLAWEELVK